MISFVLGFLQLAVYLSCLFLIPEKGLTPHFIGLAALYIPAIVCGFFIKRSWWLLAGIVWWWVSFMTGIRIAVEWMPNAPLIEAVSLIFFVFFSNLLTALIATIRD